MNKKKKQKLCLLDLLDQVGMCQTLLRIYEKKKKKVKNKVTGILGIGQFQ